LEIEMHLPRDTVTALIGRDVNDALERIMSDEIDVPEDTLVDPVEVGTVTTMEYNPNRIRLYYDPKTHMITDVRNG
jgi:hypothetical protein